jgi:CRISPR system Cascade subunit CasB
MTDLQLLDTLSKTVPKNQPNLSEVVNHISHAIKTYLGAGEIAELRRLSPKDPASPTFFKVAAQFLEPARFLPETGSWRDLLEQRWACILQGLALLGELHQPRKNLGEALAEAGFSELRFVRLLKGQGTTLWDAVRGAARFLNSKGQAVDWSEMADLVLSDGADWAETVRRRISRRFYATTLKTQEGDTKK